MIAGTGSNCTQTAIYLSQEAEKYGADGLLLVSPYYNKATQKGLIAHFTAIANSVKIPIILYNIQGRTGVNMTPETIAYLTKHVENIVAVKEASGNISQIAKVAQLCGDLSLIHICIGVQHCRTLCGCWYGIKKWDESYPSHYSGSACTAVY